MIALIFYRGHKVHYDAAAVVSADPTKSNPAYANLIRQWQQESYIKIDGVNEDMLLTNIQNLTNSNLSASQKISLVDQTLNLIKAHHTGNADYLKLVLMPCDESGGQPILSNYGNHRIPAILTHAASTNESYKDYLKKPLWKQIKASWDLTWSNEKLSNWWDCVSFDHSQCWTYKVRTVAELPPVNSTNYGEFAGTVTGPALLTYSDSLATPLHSNMDIAAITMVVKYQNQAKPVPLVLRWKWSPECHSWYPFDSCVGVVGSRLPDPFF